MYMSSTLELRHSIYGVPLLLMRYKYDILYSTYTRQLNRIHLASGRLVISLLITYLYATLPDSLDLLYVWYFFRLLLHIFWLGDTVRNLGWGPKIRHLVYPTIPLWWKVRLYRTRFILQVKGF